MALGRRLVGGLRNVALGLLVAVFTLVAVVFFLLHGSLAPLEGEVVLEGPRAEVVLDRDARGRVTVRALDRLDLAYGLGYVHGQDRFFQMDLLRRAGEGTLAAVVGRSAVDIDRGARRHDLAGTARAALDRTTAEERAPLEAYARGVNAGLASLRARPWEYFVLRQSPRPWRVIDCYHVVLAMYRDLQDENNRRERALDLASRVLDPSVFDLLTVREGPWETPVTGGPGPWPRAYVPVRGPTHVEASDEALEPETVPSPDEQGAWEEDTDGSNSWAVAGRFTEDGRALLANDMHLGLAVPPTWYAARLVVTGADSLDAVGVTLAGTPGLVVGSNGAIAWGFTNSYGDWLDHVVLEVDPADSTRYRDGTRWRRLVPRRERIEVAGGDFVEYEVQQSVWGPVVGRDAEGRPLTLRWVAQDAEAVDLRLMDMVDARTVRDALDLAPLCGVPQQNFVVASSDGEIGWTVLGRVPRRVGLDGPRPRVWADGEVGWFGWLGPDEVPRITTPAHGRLWTANARVVDVDDQRVMGDGGYALGARARRIRDRLFAREEFDEGALFDIQFDTRAELMQTWWERLVALVDASSAMPEQERVRALLQTWSGEAEANSTAYRLVREWRTRVTTVVLGAIAAPMRASGGEELVFRLPRTEVAVSALLGARPAWVPEGHPSWEELERACLLEVLATWGEPGKWSGRTWGARNATNVRHPLSVALPGWLARRIDLPARAISGDAFVPRVDGRAFGASQRLVVAPGAEERGILQMPGPANAHPLRRGRTTEYEDWIAGRPVPLLPGPTVHTLRLRTVPTP